MKILVVGAGLYGAVMTRKAMEKGYDVTVLERRKHVAGNCWSRHFEGIDIHMHGPHIFHTSMPDVWEYAQQFAEFEPFHMHAQATYRDKLYSFPINLQTMKEIWGVQTPEEARIKLESVKLDLGRDPRNAEEWAYANIGKQLYEMFIGPYMRKQWNKDPAEMPAFIIKRLPIRFTYNDSYYNDPWVGIPKEGYTKWIENMLDGATIELETDFDKTDEKHFDKIIYSGQLDELFDYTYGPLEYRSLRFEHKLKQIKDYQGIPMVTFPEAIYPYTRKIEHKHFLKSQHDLPHTVVTTEFPEDWKPGERAYYPINTEENIERANQYNKLANKKIGKYIIGGRLGTYKYLDMDKTIKLALNHSKKL